MARHLSQRRKLDESGNRERGSVDHGQGITEGQEVALRRSA